MLKRSFAVAYLFAALLFTGGAVTIAQSPPEKVDLETIKLIREEGLTRSQVMEIATFMTDVHGPRLTNSPEFRAACEWARAKLAEWGLQNARLEKWGPFGRGWSLDSFTANMTVPTFSPLIGYPKAWSPSTNGVVRGQPVYLDAKNDAELETFKGKLKGAIVLISPPVTVRPGFEPDAIRYSDERLLEMANADVPGAGAPSPTPLEGRRRFQMTPEQRDAFAMTQKKWALCYAEGAAVVLEGSRGGNGTLFIGSVTMPPAEGGGPNRLSARMKESPPAIPQFVLAADHYNRMVRLTQKSVPLRLEVGLTSKFHDEDLMSYNVVAEIPGSDLKDELVMLGAHYDSWHASTGATDNAAGSAVCMEAMRILQTLGLKPRRTIRMALWGGEEQGLLGSRAHVEQHFASRSTTPAANGQTPPLQLKPAHEKFSVYFNLDNGTGKIRGIYLQGNEATRPIFRAWLAPFRDLGAATITPANTGGTDHQAFDAVGLPGFQFIQDPIDYGTRTHHTNLDNMDHLVEDDLKQAATIMAAFVYQAAMREQKLPRKPMTAPGVGRAQPR